MFAFPAENLRLDRPLVLSRVSRFAPINANCAPLTIPVPTGGVLRLFFSSAVIFQTLFAQGRIACTALAPGMMLASLRVT